MKILLSEKNIAKIVSRLADKINRDYQDKNLIVIGVLKGSVVFLADLIRKLKMPLVLDFIQVSSYQGVKSSGKIKILKDLSIGIGNKNVLIVEDIVDTGRTLKLLKAELEKRKPASLKFAAMLDKPSRREVEFAPDYVGQKIPDEFVVGYGLDCDEKFRNLPYVGIYK